MIANFMRGGLNAAVCPHPFMIYVSKSALYVFQLLPYLTFQSTISVIAPIADFFSFSTDMFESEGSANCILKDMSGRQKLMLDLIPAIAYALELILVLVSINVWKSYSAKKAFDAAADLEEMEREQHHHEH